jgi:hypothetical protein
VNDETPTPNIPLLRKAVEWAEVEALRPATIRQWRQESYVATEEDRVQIFGHERGCGTAYCIAGYVGAILHEGYANNSMLDNVHVEDFAREQLGLTDYQSMRLFRGGNTIQQVRQVAEEIARTAGERL